MWLIRKLVFLAVGIVTYPFLAVVNKLSFSGAEHLRGLPRGNVLFVSNHQTYFADVIALFHIFGAVPWGKVNRLGFPSYLINPYTRVNYVAAEQTMSATWLSRFFTLGGAITVKRTWHAAGQETLKGLDSSDIRKITRPLASNWVITFPQGTTTPFAPGRKGTALIIKHSKPVVIPVVISGFAEAFDKQKLKLRKKGVALSVTFKAPLVVDYGASTEAILAQIMEAIEQKSPVAKPAEEESEGQGLPLEA